MNSEIVDRAQIITSKIYFDDVEIEDIISWFNFVITCGYNSLKIDLFFDGTKRTKQEIVRLFLEVKKEFNIKVTNSPKSFFQKHALNISIQYLSRKFKAKDALFRILLVIQESEDKDRYLDFMNFCFKHDILKQNLELINIKVLSNVEVIRELDSVFLSFAEQNHYLKLRIQLNRKPIKQLIYARYFDFEVYDVLSLILIDDILKLNGYDNFFIEGVIDEIESNRKK